jgi:phosphoribosyl 1,2-cyclic phosphodiesterase
MEICTFASGSTGNCAVVSHNNTHLLVDVGISLRRIISSLSFIGLVPEMISGILITHEHSDHTKALKMINKHYDIPIFATYGTTSAICCSTPELNSAITSFHAGDSFFIDEIEISSFPTPHDTTESVGYTLSAGARTLSIATDMGYITNVIYQSIKGSDTVLLESNHDVEMLKSGPYPYHLKRRIMSYSGHLSNNDCGILAAELIKTGTKRIILAHLSRENNTPKLAYETVRCAIDNADIPIGINYSLDVASTSDISPVYIV